MNTTIRSDFQGFLNEGAYCTPPGRAACALNHARTLDAWRRAEVAGLVRLRSEPERENYFDVYGEPDDERERASIVAEIERNGCWWVVSEYWDGEDWQLADSIGMCVYANPLDPFQNCYVVDLMASALSNIPQPGEN